MSATIVASLHEAGKKYKSADTEVMALQPTTIDIYSHQLMLIIGPSGSGKTTLLSLLGCVIYPSFGTVQLGDTVTNNLNQNQLSALRLHYIGFVFQSMNLIAPLSALENVMLPLKLQGVGSSQRKARALQALETVGMLDRKGFKPRNLSGGQQQRVAVARALVTDPPLLLCDEPTASLDAQSMLRVMAQLKSLAVAGKAVAVVTHDPRLIEYADRTIYVDNGKVSDKPPINVH
jgi:putative ABC transport system ATP-binding protein